VILRPVRDSGVSRLSRRDLLRAGSLGLRSRRMRAALSALGISIGIAAIVGVLGISQSSKTGLLSELGQLGNLLTAQPQSTAFGQQTELPTTAEGMVSRIGPVTDVTEIGSIANVYVYRNSFVPASDTSGISLTAADAALPATLGATLAHGTFLNAATARYPAVSKARVTIPTGLVKSMMNAEGEARRLARSAKSKTMGTVRSAFARPPAPVVS